MNIGIYSKFDCAGGSEFRGAELASGIAKFSNHNAFLISEKGLPKEVEARVADQVTVIKNVKDDASPLYDMDRIVVINTDSKSFTTLDYWNGKTDRHDQVIDLDKIKSLTFLFNFLVSPARHLHEIEDAGVDVRIITTNERFYGEIGKKDKHVGVRHLPRMVLESPIDPDSVWKEKAQSDKIRIGKHSKGIGNKWNEEHEDLIRRLNERYPDQLMWDFMGGSSDFKKSVKDIPNVVVRPEFSIPVNVYLYGIDIFLFYISYNRQEPWARVVGEALMANTPVVATDVDGGNRMQVLDSNNGYLCKSVDDFEAKLCTLIDNENLRRQMGKNAGIYSQFFTTEYLIQKLLTFLEAK